MSIGTFDTGTLRIRLKAAEDKVKAFESGEKYVQMQKQFKATFREQNASIRKLEYELGRAHAQTVSVRKKWSEIFDDVTIMSRGPLRPNAKETPHWTDCATN